MPLVGAYQIVNKNISVKREGVRSVEFLMQNLSQLNVYNGTKQPDTSNKRKKKKSLLHVQV